MKYCNIIFTLLLASTSPFLSAQDKASKLDRFLLKKMDQTDWVGMQVAYINAEGAIWANSYGFQNYQSEEPVNDSTLFMIASCSKPVTALAVLKLYHDQQLDLDQNINRYLPFQVIHPFYSEDSITTRMLLAHSASLQDNWKVIDPLYTTATGGDSPLPLSTFVESYFTPSGRYYEAEANFAEEKPGEYWAYCNMGYALLGLIIEQVSGKSFSDYMQEDIFTPLGMHNSYWFLKDIPHANIARPHRLPDKSANSDSIQILKHYGYPDYPDGQLRTTTTDYLKFIRLILNNGQINGETFVAKNIIELFHTIQFAQTNRHQAVAFNYNEFDHWLYYILMRRLPSHTGGDPGVATVVSYDPEQEIAAVVFLNSPPVNFKGGKIFYLDCIKQLLKAARKN